MDTVFTFFVSLSQAGAVVPVPIVQFVHELVDLATHVPVAPLVAFLLYYKPL